MRYLKGKMSKYASAVFELNKKNYKNGYCTFICMKLACMYSLATKGSVFWDPEWKYFSKNTTFKVSTYVLPS